MEALVPKSQMVAGAIFVAWLIGLVVLSARLIGGIAVLAMLRRSARPVEIKTKDLADVLEQVRASLGVAKLPVIASSPRLAGPAALGVLKPMVILPESWIETVPVESLRESLDPRVRPPGAPGPADRDPPAGRRAHLLAAPARPRLEPPAGTGRTRRPATTSSSPGATRSPTRKACSSWRSGSMRPAARTLRWP